MQPVGGHDPLPPSARDTVDNDPTSRTAAKISRTIFFTSGSFFELLRGNVHEEMVSFSNELKLFCVPNLEHKQGGNLGVIVTL